MTSITTHVLDTAAGRPAARVPVTLEHFTAQGWQTLGQGTTDDDGRLRSLLPPDFKLTAGVYRLIFDTGVYFGMQSFETFYPHAAVCFNVRDPSQHYHVPLLLSPYGYSTYRGS